MLTLPGDMLINVSGQPTTAGGGGGGVSALFPQPAYQKATVPASLSKLNGTTPMRVIPDVSALADPEVGFLIELQRPGPPVRRHEPRGAVVRRHAGVGEPEPQLRDRVRQPAALLAAGRDFASMTSPRRPRNSRWPGNPATSCSRSDSTRRSRSPRATTTRPGSVPRTVRRSCRPSSNGSSTDERAAPISGPPFFR